MEESKIPLVVVLGPTASGKTSVAVSIAKEFNGEVVSADSMQIYKEMSIGTAKPTDEEMKDIPHHLIDYAELNHPCSVAEYSKLAHLAIEDIYSRGKLPILAGGTGLYINSVITDMQFSENQGDNQIIRNELIYLINEKGKEAAYAILCELDPDEALVIDKNNPARLIRAIEVCKTTGMTMTEYKKKNISKTSRYNTLKIGLSYCDRNLLYDKINRRVDLMLEAGLLSEAEAIIAKDTKTSMQAIGYKEFIPYFRKTNSLSECVEKLKQESRRYAKRQLTWFRRDNSIQWFYRDNFDSSYEYQKNINHAVDNFLHM